MLKRNRKGIKYTNWLPTEEVKPIHVYIFEVQRNNLDFFKKLDSFQKNKPNPRGGGGGMKTINTGVKYWNTGKQTKIILFPWKDK